MKRIEWKPKAFRQLRKIKDLKQQALIHDAVSALSSFPDCANVKRIKTTDMYRLRVGSWRVFFTESFEILWIEEVKKRNENTYR
ncbi:MAG: type II toxin-antitoxin system RelE/ParE family toxin [bacterium]|nr:type II toxin-antitoxin system RelE/ParE family toxin [bacterium]